MGYYGRTEYAPINVKYIDTKATTDGHVVFISKALIMLFEAPLFFANCRTLSKNLIHAMNKTTRWKGCVIDLGSCGWIDVTACDVLKIPIQLYGKEGYPVYLARCNEMTKQMLIGAGVV